MKWIESMARVKAAAGKKRMHQKLTRITKGNHGGLDYIEVPSSEWYYSPGTNELYHYDKGVFEAHPAQRRKRKRSTWIFHPHHSLKVIPDDAREVTPVERIEDRGFQITNQFVSPSQLGPSIRQR